MNRFKPIYCVKPSAKKKKSYPFLLPQPTVDFNFYSLYQTVNHFPAELWCPEERGVLSACMPMELIGPSGEVYLDSSPGGALGG